MRHNDARGWGEGAITNDVLKFRTVTLYLSNHQWKKDHLSTRK